MTRETSKRSRIVGAGVVALAAMLAMTSLTPVAEAQRSGGKGKPEQPVRPAGPTYEYSSGIVLSYDAPHQILTLSTGGTYHVRSALAENTVAPGDKVKLRWIRDAGERQADQVEVTMKAPTPAPAAASAQAPAAPTTPASEPAAPPAS